METTEILDWTDPREAERELREAVNWLRAKMLNLPDEERRRWLPGAKRKGATA